MEKTNFISKIKAICLDTLSSNENVDIIESHKIMVTSLSAAIFSVAIYQGMSKNEVDSTLRESIDSCARMAKIEEDFLNG